MRGLLVKGEMGIVAASFSFGSVCAFSMAWHRLLFCYCRILSSFTAHTFGPLRLFSAFFCMHALERCESSTS